MSKSRHISNNEKQFILKLLSDDKERIDHRRLDEFRNVQISFGESLGSCDIRLGNTRLIVRVSAEVARPYEDRPFEGQFLITTNISSMASPMFENHRTSDDEVLISRLIEKAIRRSKALDLESLCIVAGKSCWLVRADVHYLDFDGGLVDATCIGVIAALLHFRKPQVTIEADNKPQVHSIEERVPVPLSILHVPICVTFAFFKTSEEPIVIVDPTAREEALENSKMTLTMNKNRDICQISKPGGLSMSASVLLQCSETAYRIVSEITDLIHRRLKEDDVVRNKGNRELIAENDRTGSVTFVGNDEEIVV